MRARWNHNIHYHPVILAALPNQCQRVLDVGCGEGTLARQLRAIAPGVTAIDRDPASIGRARHHERQEIGANNAPIDYVLDDFLSHPFALNSFDAIVSVAALHHMDTVAALARMRELLRPGGTLAIVGLARSRLPTDLPWEAAAIIAHRWYRWCWQRTNYWEQTSPTIWPPPHTYPEMHQLATTLLPEARYRRRLLWRYTLIWTKPPIPGDGASENIDSR